MDNQMQLIGSDKMEDVLNGRSSLLKVKVKGKEIRVVEEGKFLKYGTKMRGYKFFEEIEKAGYIGISVSGTTHGMGQAAVAWGCKQHNLKCVVFVAKEMPRTIYSQSVMDMGLDLKEVGDGVKFVKSGTLENKAEEYAKRNKGFYYMQAGLFDQLFIKALTYGISHVKNVYRITPNEIWVAGGTGVMAKALSNVFPGVKINIVQVGRNIWKDVIEGVDHKIWYYPKKLGSFMDDAVEKPPFHAMTCYDAKVWYFVTRHAKSGDLVWIIK
jgi:glutaredoxin-related protein